MIPILPALAFAFLSLPIAAAPVDAFELNRKLGRGVNILGYDPVWKAAGEGRFQDRHFSLLRAAGFSHVRVNLHPFRHMGAAPEFTLPDAWFAVLDRVLRESAAAGLMVVLDCHEFHAMGKDPVGNREKFLAFWRQLAAHLEGAPDSVLFELLNEPHELLTPEIWNELLREALAVIRPAHPARGVIVGPGFWNSIGKLDSLDLPENDRGLIVTVHYYLPMEFTHQGASWSDHRDRTGVDWAGSDAEREAIRDRFAKAAAWAAERRRPLYLGEFGAYDKGEMAARARYTDAVARTAEAFGWSWAYWQFDSDFLLYDIPANDWIEPIRAALVPPTEPAAVPIFNGRDLTGWEGEPGWWTVEDGAITTESAPDKPCKAATYLIWRGGTPGDFELTCEFKLSPDANSGIQLRSETRPNWDTYGFQADMTGDGSLTGFVYHHRRGLVAGRGESVEINPDGRRVATPSADPDALLKAFRPGEWNRYRMVCRGPEINVFLNDCWMCRITDRDPATAAGRGIIALQMHPGPPMRAQFRNLRLRSFDQPSAP
jgi:endoglucanase